MTSRRQFVQGAAGLGLLAGCGRLPGQAQQARVFRIGYLSGASASSDTVLLAAFIQGLHERGWVEGQNVRLEPRYSDGRDDPLPGLAAELVSLPIDVLLTTGVPATRAAKQATSTLPIVMASSTDPVGTGLVSSLARPGANVTGLSSASAQLAAKRLQLLKEAAPSISRVAVIRGPEFIDREREALAAVAAALALELHILLVRGADELDGLE